MKKYTITDRELSAIADLLNEIKDKDGALLRPTEKTFMRAWTALAVASNHEQKLTGWEITFKNGQKESFATYSVALGYATQFGLGEPVEVDL